MSENENLPEAPSKQTASIPLKKETVRVTLKAADAPPATPAATVPSAAPVRPPTPTAPPTPSIPPTATIPGGAPRPSPAPTVPLRSAGPPAMAKPAPTIRLASVGAPTAPVRPAGLPAVAGSPTIALPKATVQLQAPTRALNPTSQGTSPFTATGEEEYAAEESGLGKILTIVGFAAAVVVLASQLMVANVWTDGDFGKIFG